MSEKSPQFEPYIWEVFDVYKKAGVLDESEIIENIAFFALLWNLRDKEKNDEHYLSKFINLEKMQLPIKILPFLSIREILATKIQKNRGENVHNSKSGLSNISLIPSPPGELDENAIEIVGDLLQKIFEQIPDLGKWFDQYLIPRLTSSSKGGRYATPRHLIQFMEGIVNLTRTDSLADFACGTGGLLVANGVVERATGVEISPNMARLALTNLILHGQEQHDLYLGNTFELAWKDEGFRSAKFDVILMNPPFGASIDPYLVEKTFGGEYTGRSESLFASLAYEKLKSGGRMAVLVPSGALFSNSLGEKIFREMLVEEGALRAVISLPRDSMQPVNNLQTHVLYAVKPKNDNAQNDVIWFYRPRYDGLTSGRNRQPDLKHNDLPLIQAACKVPISKKGMAATPLMEEGQALGYYFEGDSSITFQIIDLGGAYLVNVFEQSALSEVIYTYQEQIYRGAPIQQPLPIDTTEKVKLKGEYTLESLFGQGDEIPTCSIKLSGTRGEIRKGVLGKVRFGEPTKDENKATGVFLNEAGEVISKPISLIMDKFGSSERPLGFSIPSALEDGTNVDLLIFYEGVKGNLLTGDNGKTVCLCDVGTKKGINLLYYPAKKKFGWSLAYRVGTKGETLSLVNEIFKSDQSRNGVVIDNNGNVLGIGVHRGEIQKTKGSELQWEKYWDEKKQIVGTRSSAQILGDIKRQQNKLTHTLDRLLSISEVQPMASTELPPRLNLTLPPPGLLQGIQQSIWEIVQKQVEDVDGYQTPHPFQAHDIQGVMGEIVSVADVQRALELIERLGLIVAVSYEGAPYYRLPEERDLVKGGEA